SARPSARSRAAASLAQAQSSRSPSARAPWGIGSWPRFRSSSTRTSATPARSSAATAIFIEGLVLLPAGELAAGEFLQRCGIIGELGGEIVADRVREVRLRCRWGLRVVHDLLDHPAQPLGEAVEVPIEGAEARQLDQPFHEL